ncbi:hypothetical protein PPERSA_12625 [Pseudocohnilembus persalinus]|uniref:Uncharacterized protein n=1 Tax=Pseudocohnilembus persalinus TaxID=266149 RepID=A0A0V0QCH8_PSEPJ|nr:hypothetical protein PPERSA_12625 [Pseudocohnilembus persalinus]|eukprot:KRW99949.1 hypothetical protein PPERSA_12625 [Pseudocohnilembus persalinus]
MFNNNQQIHTCVQLNQQLYQNPLPSTQFMEYQTNFGKSYQYNEDFQQNKYLYNFVGQLQSNESMIDQMKQVKNDNSQDLKKQQKKNTFKPIILCSNLNQQQDIQIGDQRELQCMNNITNMKENNNFQQLFNQQKINSGKSNFVINQNQQLSQNSRQNKNNENFYNIAQKKQGQGFQPVKQNSIKNNKFVCLLPSQINTKPLVSNNLNKLCDQLNNIQGNRNIVQSDSHILFYKEPTTETFSPVSSHEISQNVNSLSTLTINEKNKKVSRIKNKKSSKKQSDIISSMNNSNSINNNIELHQIKKEHSEKEESASQLNLKKNDQNSRKVVKFMQNKRINTSHVPLNMYNQLFFHLKNIYNKKIQCKCQKSDQKKELNEEQKQKNQNQYQLVENDLIRESINSNQQKILLEKQNQIEVEEEEEKEEQEQKNKQVNLESQNQEVIPRLYQQLGIFRDIYNNNDNSNNIKAVQKNENQNCVKNSDDEENKNNKCKRCNEWEQIEKIKQLKKKNIETFRILWGISKRVQILSENFFLNYATNSILGNKMYRTLESKQAVYTCLPNFLDGSRNYQIFYRILG